MATELDLSGLQAFLAGLDDAIDAGAQQGAEFIVDVHRQIAPVDEGDWRDSAEVRPGTAKGERIVAAGGDKAPHGIIVEYGDPSNPNYPAQPTLGPAADAIDVSLEVKKQIEALAQRSQI